MLKKRLIFTLLARDGRFMLSRNFSLQAAGDLAWIYDVYEFESIALAIDELVILDVARDATDRAAFAALVQATGRGCFMPIAAGGHIRSLDDARRLLDSGADKLVVNTPVFTDPALVRRLVEHFGGQSVVASIDYQNERGGGGPSAVRIDCGRRDAGVSLVEAMQAAERLGVGELYVTSIARDGTGQGLDHEHVARCAADVGIPVVIAGGAGKPQHFVEALGHREISGAATANLFNFMGAGLSDARRHLIASGVPLPVWETWTPG